MERIALFSLLLSQLGLVGKININDEIFMFIDDKTENKLGFNINSDLKGLIKAILKFAENNQ